jgi:thiamine-monophosphate kinase
LIGGDTDRSEGPLSIAITVLGEVQAGRMVRRATARPGDVLFVTGTLGDAALGLKQLRQPQFAAAHGLDAGEAAHTVGRFLRPNPRLAIGPLLMDHASAAMDLSDGLVKDLGRMCAASGVAAAVRVADLPLTPAVRKCGPEAVVDALSAGDDYEVLAAVPETQVAEFLAHACSLTFAVTRIGEVTAGAGVSVIDADGRPMHLPRTGWDHF